MGRALGCSNQDQIDWKPQRDWNRLETSPRCLPPRPLTTCPSRAVTISFCPCPLGPSQTRPPTQQPEHSWQQQALGHDEATQQVDQVSGGSQARGDGALDPWRWGRRSRQDPGWGDRCLGYPPSPGPGTHGTGAWFCTWPTLNHCQGAMGSRRQDVEQYLQFLWLTGNDLLWAQVWGQLTPQGSQRHPRDQEGTRVHWSQGQEWPCQEGWWQRATGARGTSRQLGYQIYLLQQTPDLP